MFPHKVKSGERGEVCFFLCWSGVQPWCFLFPLRWLSSEVSDHRAKQRTTIWIQPTCPGSISPLMALGRCGGGGGGKGDLLLAP